MMKKRLLPIFVLLLCTMLVRGQFVDTTLYDFRDGSIITAGQSTDGSLKLSGTYSHHNGTYGLNMKSGAKIKIAVHGACIVRFLGSKHSSLSMSGATVGGTSLNPAEVATFVTNDLIDTYEFAYSGFADTLVFIATGAGTDVYLPLIEVIPSTINAVTWVEKSGTIIINNDTISLTAGATASDNAIVTLVKGTIESATAETATVRIDLGGHNLDSFTPIVTGDISGVSLVNDTIYVAYADSSAMPFGYAINVLKPWVEKTGIITINGINISVTAGAAYDAKAVVTVSEGTVISATDASASIRIDLGGYGLDSYTPSISGDISKVILSNDTIYVAYADSTKEPYGYILIVTDNSLIVSAEPGKTYSYDFANGSVLPQIGYKSFRYNTFITNDGIVTMNSNTTTEALQLGYHDATHGAVLFPGNSFELIVAENATINFAICQYGSVDPVFIISDISGAILDTISASNKGAGIEGTSSFSYTGPAGIITATIYSASNSSAEVYIHGLTIENSAIIEPSGGKIEVWDFGAVALDTAVYKNNLTADIINAWYASSIVVGSSANTLPSFSAGVLSWVGGGNDRLRTSNTNLTRYDENIGGAVDYTGRVYVNSAANPGRYMSLTLSADDKVSLVTKTDAGGNLNFQYVADPLAQTDQIALSVDVAEVSFVAKEAGTYHIFDNLGKPSYFRIYREDAKYVSISGTTDVSAATGIPTDYAILFTNEAGKIFTATMNPSDYSMRLPIGYTYKLSLSGANGYIINSGNSLTVTDTTTVFDVAIEKVELYTVNGSVTGLGANLSKLSLIYSSDTSAHKIYIPEPIIDYVLGTYSVQLEPNCEYTISAIGVNDFYIPKDTITIGKADAMENVAFAAKPLYDITINATGLNAEQLAAVNLTFSNLNEKGYTYTYTSVSGIALRNGSYTIAYNSLDNYPVEMELTSNLTVADASASKDLIFSAVTNWPFNDKVIANGTPAYKGILFTGAVYNEVAKGHLVAKTGSTIQIPVNVGDKVRITFYYSADFSIDGGSAITTTSGSTSTFEFVDYVYTGTDAGFVTLTNGTETTYFTDITIGETVDYTPVISVGTDKDFQTINGALDAIAKMIRENDERVTVMIDPDNYEEMLVINVANITFKNASLTPDIALANAGVDISENAVRITSYYGHGYNYYSMENNQKWNADRLRVNKENGYLSYENKGSGTTNGSYWNATVVVNANGFEAENIIFENSFNQYISLKEADDIVEVWESGSKGERSTIFGSTDVQNKSFVERAAAISITTADKVVLNRCRVIGRQDSFYGGTGSRVVVYKGSMMGGTDYLFGAMTSVFYKTNLAMNTSEDNNDVSYLTAAQQAGGRGYLMFECNVTSATPGTETASLNLSKPGYFGRPWQATTSEVVFYNTKIKTTDFPGYDGESLILPEGWNSSLGGESAFMYEYGSIEESGVDNLSGRASWATILDAPTLTDGTEITTFNFTKGTDDWDPIPALIANDPNPNDTIPELPDAIFEVPITLMVNVYAAGNTIYVSNVTSTTQVNIYSISGSLVKTFETSNNTEFEFQHGLWIVRITSTDGQKAVKVITR